MPFLLDPINSVSQVESDINRHTQLSSCWSPPVTVVKINPFTHFLYFYTHHCSRFQTWPQESVRTIGSGLSPDFSFHMRNVAGDSDTFTTTGESERWGEGLGLSRSARRQDVTSIGMCVIFHFCLSNMLEALSTRPLAHLESSSKSLPGGSVWSHWLWHLQSHIPPLRRISGVQCMSESSSCLFPSYPVVSPATGPGHEK